MQVASSSQTSQIHATGPFHFLFDSIISEFLITWAVESMQIVQEPKIQKREAQKSDSILNTIAAA